MVVRPVVVVSSINLDTTLNVPTYPSAGETVLATRTGPRLGGKGANVAVAVARSGLAPSILAGAIGEDGRWLLSELSASRVDTSLVAVLPDADTGAAYVLLDTAGANTIIVAIGANKLFKPERGLAHAMRGSVVVLHLEIDLGVARDVAVVAKAAGATVVLNPSPVPKASLPFGRGDDVWRSVDLVVVNEVEAEQVSGVGEGRVEEAVLALRRRCANGARVVVTLGAKGVMFSDAAGDSVQIVPAVVVEDVVDTTGAGDTFTGFLAGGIAAGREFERCVREAVVAAAICVGREGAAGAIPKGEEVIEWLASGR